MWRTVGAVAAGYAVIGVLVVAADQVFAAMIPGFNSMKLPPLYYFWASLFTDSLFTILGGYLCARIAREKAWGAMLGLMAFGELMGVASAAREWSLVPHWFSLALMLVYPPMVWLGYTIRTRSNSGQLQTT